MRCVNSEGKKWRSGASTLAWSAFAPSSSLPLPACRTHLQHKGKVAHGANQQGRKREKDQRQLPRKVKGDANADSGLRELSGAGRKAARGVSCAAGAGAQGPASRGRDASNLVDAVAKLEANGLLHLEHARSQPRLQVGRRRHIVEGHILGGKRSAGASGWARWTGRRHRKRVSSRGRMLVPGAGASRGSGGGCA